MAFPLLAPIAWLLPLAKIIALGSVKFIVVGIGAAIAPAITANFLVNMSTGTPIKYARFRCSKGHFSEEELALIEEANQLVLDSLTDKKAQLSRRDAREFLKEVLLSMLTGIKQSFRDAPSSLASFYKRCVGFFFKS